MVSTAVGSRVRRAVSLVAMQGAAALWLGLIGQVCGEPAGPCGVFLWLLVRGERVAVLVASWAGGFARGVDRARMGRGWVSGPGCRLCVR